MLGLELDISVYSWQEAQRGNDLNFKTRSKENINVSMKLCFFDLFV